MDKQQIQRVKYACYSSGLTMSVVSSLSPVLFLTFRTLYGISYSLLGLLVLANFVTQLLVDLIFSFFSHRFDIPRTVKTIPLIAITGFIIYAGWSFLFPNNVYAGLLLGTIIFSAASGLAEALISPVIAALPADDPDREMSKLHSVFAWGVLVVITVCTVFLLVFGNENWQWLTFLLMCVPIVSAFLFAGCKMPEMQTPGKVSGALKLLKNKQLWFCFFMIFLGGAAELVMSQWSSSYLEQAMGIPKIWGDLFGVALFGLTMGIGRTLYSKIGKNIGRVLTLGAIGATLCYFLAAVSNIPFVGLFACAFTGFCVSMLWPGSLVVAAEKFPESGVFIYAMMAAGGDLGASVGPQLVGIITDAVIAHPKGLALAADLQLTADQLGLKLGMLCGMLFPLAAIFFFLSVWKKKTP